VRVTAGNTPIGELDNGPVDDVVVQDDFIYGEPANPVPPTVPPQLVAIGKGQGASVDLLNASFHVTETIAAFGTTFTGGVRVAQADVNGDGIDELVVGTGPGA